MLSDKYLCSCFLFSASVCDRMFDSLQAFIYVWTLLVTACTRQLADRLEGLQIQEEFEEVQDPEPNPFEGMLQGMPSRVQ